MQTAIASVGEQPRLPRRRAADADQVDDVLVKDVSVFRAEMLTDTDLWLACYLPGTGAEDDRLTFLVSVEDGRLRLRVEERPTGAVPFE